MKTKEQLEKRLKSSEEWREELCSKFLEDVEDCLENWSLGMIIPNVNYQFKILDIEIKLLEWILQK